jgi:hypothetical protein
MLRLLVVGGLLAPLAVAGTASGALGATEVSATFDVLGVTGAGCPAGSAAVAPSPDGTAVTVTYSSFLAETSAVAADGSTVVGTPRSSCRVRSRVSLPRGYTYAVSQVDLRGYAHLEPGAVAELTTGYSFGQFTPRRNRHRFAGPLDGEWATTDRPATGRLRFVDCRASAIMTMDVGLSVSGGDPGTQSFIAVDSADLSGTAGGRTTYHLRWRRCA